MENNLTDFSYNTILTLSRSGIATISDLARMSNDEIARIRGLGRKGYNEIIERLGRVGNEKQD